MNAAARPGSNARMLIVRKSRIENSSIANLPDYIDAGDVVVVNDAATLPASLFGRSPDGSRLEIRLLSQIKERTWESVAFGTGDWRTPTELREPPPQMRIGDRIDFDGIGATLVETGETSGRLLVLEFDLAGEALWRFIYEQGSPIQYSYMSESLSLWSVQNIYSGRPWAIEMPSAGRALTWSVLLSLLRKGVRVVSLTHAAGISATGDPRIDSRLPLTERFEIPTATLAAIQRAHATGNRVVAIGTSVVRALESHALGISRSTSLRIGSSHTLRLVNALVTGTHDSTESHYQLLGSFLPHEVLQHVSAECERMGYLTHEFGDLCLIFDHRTSDGYVRASTREAMVA